MMCTHLKQVKNYQRGFTLIELSISLAISSLIALTLVMTTFNVINVGAESTEHIVAIRDGQNTGHWISIDVSSADMVTVGPGNGFPLIITRTEYNGTYHEVTYSIVSTELRRSHSVNGGLSSETLIAIHIDPIETSCQFADGILELTVTTKSGDGVQEHGETRVYKASGRPTGS